jgi:tetratricopeptide (TPR) repeat protein
MNQIINPSIQNILVPSVRYRGRSLVLNVWARTISLLVLASAVAGCSSVPPSEGVAVVNEAQPSGGTARATPPSKSSTHDVEAEYQKGYQAFFQHQYTRAIQIENDVIKKSPSFYPAYNVKGIALCYSGDFKDGMANIERALQLNPNYGYGHFNKALALERYGHYTEALTEYQKAIKYSDNHWKMWSYYGIASIYGRRGDVENTVKYLKMAIAMNPALIKQHARTEADFNPVRHSEQFQQLIR